MKRTARSNDETCFRYRCSARIVTWEIDHGLPDSECFPNGVCATHAIRPDVIGTLEAPTSVSHKDCR